MAKQTGLGDYIAVDDSGGTARDISDNVTNFDITVNQALIDVTTISKSAMERLIGLGDLQVTLTMAFDAAANKQHAVFENRAGTRTFDLRIGGNTSSNPRLQAECLISDYNFSRGTDGTATTTATLQLQSGTVPDYDTVP